MRGPIPAISLSSSSQPRIDFFILWFSCRNFSIILDRRCQLPRAASETASSDDLSSVSPGTMLYLTETDHPEHIGLFSMPDFDFLSDLDRQLRSPLLRGAQESLSSKTAVKPSLPVPVNHAKPVSSVPASSAFSQSTVIKYQSIFRPIFSIQVNRPLPITSQTI